MLQHLCIGVCLGRETSLLHCPDQARCLGEILTHRAQVVHLVFNSNVPMKIWATEHNFKQSHFADGWETARVNFSEAGIGSSVYGRRERAVSWIKQPSGLPVLAKGLSLFLVWGLEAAILHCSSNSSSSTHRVQIWSKLLMETFYFTVGCLRFINKGHVHDWAQRPLTHL